MSDDMRARRAAAQEYLAAHKEAVARAIDPSRATITRQDVGAAQAVLDAWTTTEAFLRMAQEDTDEAANGAMAYLRGLITQAITDAHARGYDEGVARGRRLVANAVRDALDGEGLL